MKSRIPFASALAAASLFAAAIAAAQSVEPPVPPADGAVYSQSAVDAKFAELQAQIDALQSAQSSPVYYEGPAPAAEPPKYPSVKVTGFFQVDSAWFDQTGLNEARVGDAPDGTDFRRARLAAVGQVWENVGYMVEMDFAFPGRPSFMDVWAEVQDIGGSGATFRVGQFRQPFGFTAMTSIREITFLERPLPFAFLPFRQTGVMLYGTAFDDLATYGFSGFRYPVDPYGGSVGDNGGYGFSSRLTGLLVDNDCGIVHVGGGYEHLDPASDEVQYRQTPEIFVSETGTAPIVPPGLTQIPFFVDTGVLDVDTVNLFNAELAASYGSWHSTTEFFYAHVDRNMGQSQLGYSGAYNETGYFLTGERREYNKKNGVFGRVKPLCPVGFNGGCGAWEVAGRLSYIDLSDEDVQGGKLTDATAGLNWYMNQYMKFQFNYIHAFLDAPAGGEADVYAVRCQLDF